MPSESERQAAPAPDLLQVSDLGPRDLDALLDLASRMKEDGAAWLTSFPGESIVCYFESSSARVGSFEAAAHRLGLLPIVMRREDLRLGPDEPIGDSVRALTTYAAAIVMRISSHGALEQAAEAADVPVVNALSELHHPCQALTDLLTLREHFGGFSGLTLAYVGDADNIANSLIEACGLAGVELRIACPEAFVPDPRVLASAQQSGTFVSITADPREAVSGADAVYTNPWVPTGGAYERERRKIQLVRYRVSPALMAEASPDAIFMHAMPAHRGEEAWASVIDGPESVVWTQVANRLPIEQAVLHSLISRSRDPRPA